MKCPIVKCVVFRLLNKYRRTLCNAPSVSCRQQQTKARLADCTISRNNWPRLSHAIVRCASKCDHWPPQDRTTKRNQSPSSAPAFGHYLRRPTIAQPRQSVSLSLTLLVYSRCNPTTTIHFSALFKQLVLRPLQYVLSTTKQVLA